MALDTHCVFSIGFFNALDTQGHIQASPSTAELKGTGTFPKMHLV